MRSRWPAVRGGPRITSAPSSFACQMATGWACLCLCFRSGSLPAARGGCSFRPRAATRTSIPAGSSRSTRSRKHSRPWPRDPDQVVEYATKVLVAAHGDKEVLAIDGEKISVWASGMPAVALAPDAALNLLAVVVNDHE